MRKILLLLILATSLSSCIYGYSDDDYQAYDPSLYYTPITASRDTVHSQIQLGSPQPAVNSGKIYIKDHLLFVIERNIGIHVYDNTDRTMPIPIHFINVNGVTDMAIKGDLIYVHHYTDMLMIRPDYNNNTLSIVSVTEDVFDQLSTPDGWEADYFTIPEDHIITGYQEI